MRLKQIQKWIKMCLGKSGLHVEQRIGKKISKNDIAGYYNDLTGKVSPYTKLDENGVPVNITYDGEKIYFGIAIAQYGLGSYDKFLLTNDKKFLRAFFNVVDWLVKNQDKKGGWDISCALKSDVGNCYSSMAQSEGASVLIRAYKQTNDNNYLEKAKRAIDLMITPIDKGGTMLIEENDIFFQEVVNKNNNIILNGWIFSIFGLFDIVKVLSNEKYNDILNKTIATFKKNLSNYDTGYWSYYDKEGRLASPFYHDLHIEQLKALYYMLEDDYFKKVISRWQDYQNNRYKSLKAFIIKAYQKLRDPGEIVIIE